MFPGENRDWIVCQVGECWFTYKIYDPESKATTEATTSVFMYDPEKVSSHRAQMFGRYHFSYEEAVCWVDRLNQKGPLENIGKVRGDPSYGKYKPLVKKSVGAAHAEG